MKKNQIHFWPIFYIKAFPAEHFVAYFCTAYLPILTLVRVAFYLGNYYKVQYITYCQKEFPGNINELFRLMLRFCHSMLLGI